MLVNRSAVQLHGMLLVLCLSLLAGCEQQPADRGEQEDAAGDISAPLPQILAASLPDIKGDLEIEVVVDKGTAHEARYPLDALEVKPDGSFSGKFVAKLAAGPHTFDLEYFIVTTDTAGATIRVLVARTNDSGDAVDIRAGADNPVSFSDRLLDEDVDGDGDQVPDLVELRLHTDPLSRESAPPPFTVSSVSPGNGVENVSRAAGISLSFSEEVKKDSVSSTTFNVHTDVGDVAGNYTVNGRTVDFQPAQELPGGKVVTVSLSSGLRASSGMPLTAFSSSFVTINSNAVIPLSGVQHAYQEFIGPGEALRYTVSGLDAGINYTLILSQLTQNLSLVVFTAADFKNEACGSRQIGSSDERCVAVADAQGNIYVQIDAQQASERSKFTLDMVTVTPLSGVNGSLTAAVDIGGEQRYMLQGQIADVALELTNMSGDGNLFVYSDDAFTNLLCSSQRGMTYYGTALARPSSDSCVTHAVNGGNLFIKVTGQDNTVLNSGQAVNYTLSWGAPMIAELDTTTGVWPRVLALDRILFYVKVIGLAPGGEYMLVGSKSGFPKQDPDLNVFAGPGYDAASAILQGTEGANTGAVKANANGEVYVTMDAVVDVTADLKYSFNFLPLRDITGHLPYTVTGDGKLLYFKITGLNPAQEYTPLINGDGLNASGVDNSYNVPADRVSNGKVFDGNACKNSSVNLCNTGTTRGKVPGDDGVLYFSGGSGSKYQNAPVSATVAPAVMVLPYSGRVPKGGGDFAVSLNKNKVSMVFSGLSADLDFKVYFQSLAAPDCVTSLTVDNTGSSAREYCGVHQGIYGNVGNFLLHVDGSKTVDGGDFTLDYVPFTNANGANAEMHAFGLVTNTTPPMPTSDFSPAFIGGIKMTDKYRFFEVVALVPNAPYSLSLTNQAAATAPLRLQAFTNAIASGNPSCSVGAGAPCNVTSDARGQIRVALIMDPASTTDAAFSLTLDGSQATPVTVDAVADVNKNVSLGGQKVASDQSNFFKLTGLDAAASYTVSTSQLGVLVENNLDIYLYQDAKFSTPAAGCAYALNTADPAAASCTGLTPVNGTVYVRVIHNGLGNSATYALNITH